MSAKKGDVLVCSVCDADYAEFLEPIIGGAILKAHMMKSLQGQTFVSGEKMKCGSCGSSIRPSPHYLKEEG